MVCTRSTCSLCRYRKMSERLRAEQSPDRMLPAPEFAFRFLMHCRNLMLYGSTFFLCRTLARQHQPSQTGAGGGRTSPIGVSPAGPSISGLGSGGRKKNGQQHVEVNTRTVYSYCTSTTVSGDALALSDYYSYRRCCSSV